MVNWSKTIVTQISNYDTQINNKTPSSHQITNNSISNQHGIKQDRRITTRGTHTKLQLSWAMCQVGVNECRRYLGKSSNLAPSRIPLDTGRTCARYSWDTCASILRCSVHSRRHPRSPFCPAWGECRVDSRRCKQSCRTYCGTCPGRVRVRCATDTRWCLHVRVHMDRHRFRLHHDRIGETRKLNPIVQT